MTTNYDIETDNPHVEIDDDFIFKQMLQKDIDKWNSLTTKCKISVSVIFGIVQIILGAIFKDNKHSFMTFSTWLLMNGFIIILLMGLFIKDICNIMILFNQLNCDLNQVKKVTSVFKLKKIIYFLFWYAWFIYGIILLSNNSNYNSIKLKNTVFATIIIQACCIILQVLYSEVGQTRGLSSYT